MIIVHPFANQPRAWCVVSPIKKQVTEEYPFCPWCDTQLDGAYAYEGVDRCKCGEWSINYKGEWTFQRFKTQEEERIELKKQIEKQEKDLERLRRAYGEET